MNLRLVVCVALAASLAIPAFAADVTGKWKISFEMNGEKREGAMNLKVDGSKLTGTMESTRGTSEISEGKIDGDTISFVVIRNFNGNEVKISYKGKVIGDEMKLSVDFNGNELPMTAKRI